MKKSDRIGLFKRFKLAVYELENYIQFLTERFTSAIGFCFKITVIFSLILAFSNLGYIYIKYGSPGKYLDNIIPNFIYRDRQMTIEEDKNDNEQKKAVASVMKRLDLTYVEIFQTDVFEKADLINYVNSNEARISTLIVCVIFIESILDLFSFWIMMGFLTSFVGWIALKFIRIKMKYSKLYELSLYSSTLTITLTVIYTMLNIFFGINIEVFDYLVMIIAYIYITAVIYMIKSDLITQQLELMKIINVTEKYKPIEGSEEKKEEKDNNEDDDTEPETDVKTKEREKPDSSEI